MHPPVRRSAPLLAFFIVSTAAGCRAKAPALEAPFSDTFERAEVGADWHDTGGGYELKGGRLAVKGAYNHPLWLRKRLPRNVVVDLDVTSQSPQGDIKVELFGDGETFDPDKNQYVASGYVFIFGGWGNSLSIIARRNEHDEGVRARRAGPQVEPGRTYHFTIARRDGATLEWSIDGQPFLSFKDPEPFYGTGYEFFAFNNWESDLVFDNLKIAPLP